MDTKLVWRWYRTGLMAHGAWLLQSSSPQPEQVFQLTLQVATGMEKLRREGCAGSSVVPAQSAATTSRAI